MEAATDHVINRLDVPEEFKKKLIKGLEKDRGPGFFSLGQRLSDYILHFRHIENDLGIISDWSYRGEKDKKRHLGHIVHTVYVDEFLTYMIEQEIAPQEHCYHISLSVTDMVETNLPANKILNIIDVAKFKGLYRISDNIWFEDGPRKNGALHYQKFDKTRNIIKAARNDMTFNDLMNNGMIHV